MITDPALVSDTQAFARLIADKKVSFFDFGCSSGGGSKWVREATDRTGFGFDIDADKLQLASQTGLLCCEYDLLTLADTKLVDFTIIFHMLEHLFSVEQAAQFIRKAVQVSRHHVVIKQPFYDTDPQLFRLGLKTFYSHWTGHRNQMTTPDFFFILEALRKDGWIRDFVIAYKKPIVSSNDPIVHPLASPINCHEYDATVHPPKPAGIAFDFPLYYEIQIDIDIDGSGASPLWSHLAPEEVGYDSRRGHLPPAPAPAPTAAPAVIRKLRDKTNHSPVKFFIRDDDFTQRTDKFAKLESLAERYGDIMLATIPEGLKVTRAEADRIRENFVIAQHGFRHKSHALDGQNNEFPANRPANLVESDLAAGRAILEDWFGAGAAEHFVAPWNRFAPDHLDVLQKQGFLSYQGLGSIGFYKQLPLIGYGINFTSIFLDAKAEYDTVLAMAKQRIDSYLREVRQRITGEDIYFPVNTHHLMMDDQQFLFFERMIQDFEALYGFECSSASNALTYFAGLSARRRLKPEDVVA